MTLICGALRNLVPFVQFKKREKHPRRNVNFSKVAGCKVNNKNTRTTSTNDVTYLHCGAGCVCRKRFSYVQLSK